MLNFELPPLSLYIHTPWCIKKCPYCDFNSHTLIGALPEENYIKALLQDLENDLPKVQNRELMSIFIGGGTPSLFSPSAINVLLENINKKISFNPNIEITLEANPGTVEQKRFEGFYAAGINRLSIGIQSFNDEKLKQLGRIHGQEEAIKAIKSAKIAGFKNFNLDLMFGLPNQSVEEALNDLNTAISLEPTHISWYQLTLEPNTYFAHHPPPLPEHDILYDMHITGLNLLSKIGFKQYEVSAFAKKNAQSQHNLNYWEFGDYLGIGAGAHSKITQEKWQYIERKTKIKHPKLYLAADKNFILENKILTNEELIFEFMLNTLRLLEPIKLSLFTARTNLPSSVLAKPILQARELSFLDICNDAIQLTPKGRSFLNDVMAVFLED